MARKIDLTRLKAHSIREIEKLLRRVEQQSAGEDYLLIRWMCRMSAVELHAVWERYAENRLVASLNHDSTHFISEQKIKGVSDISKGLAFYIVRGGNRYFDFRSMGDLIGKGNRIVGKDDNPFCAIPNKDRKYLDALAVIRNRIVHGSDAAIAAYKATLAKVYAISAAPGPDEFLGSIDKRAASPVRNERRLVGLAAVVIKSINVT